MASWPRWSPETGLVPGTCHTASSAISLPSEATSFPSNAAYKRSTRAAFGCSNIRITSPWSEGLRVVLVLKAFAHHVRAHILQEGELVAARILEEQARAGRDLEGPTFGLPSSGSRPLGFCRLSREGRSRGPSGRGD